MGIKIILRTLWRSSVLGTTALLGCAKFNMRSVITKYVLWSAGSTGKVGGGGDDYACN